LDLHALHRPLRRRIPEDSWFFGGPRARSSGALRGGRLPGAGRRRWPSSSAPNGCVAVPQTIQRTLGSGAATSALGGLPGSHGRSLGQLAQSCAGVGSKGSIGVGRTGRLGAGLGCGREAPQGHSCCAWPGCRAFGARALRERSDHCQRLRGSEEIGARRR
jgi:hypothetical protein